MRAVACFGEQKRPVFDTVAIKYVAEFPCEWKLLCCTPCNSELRPVTRLEQLLMLIWFDVHVLLDCGHVYACTMAFACTMSVFVQIRGQGDWAAEVLGG